MLTSNEKTKEIISRLCELATHQADSDPESLDLMVIPVTSEVSKVVFSCKAFSAEIHIDKARFGVKV